ncbi:MAG TPA: STAS domain-containing protein [Mycobacteriales bacterium]|nr:STAS domain-containing protein [Mycobacteriales bacterium]
MLGEVTVRSDATVVALHGDIDLLTVDALRALLDDVMAAKPQRLVVDLADADYVDVLSLTVMLGAADAMQEAGGELLVRGANAAVRRVCGILNAADILEPEAAAVGPRPRGIDPAARDL